MSWSTFFGVASFLLVGSVISLPTANAQPLVTGGLVVYYDFDDFVDEVLDESGNGLHGSVLDGDPLGEFGFDANDDGLPDIRLSTDAVRGGGSAHFDTDPTLKEDRIEICQGYDPSVPKYCDDLDKELLPLTAVTIAAWMKVDEVGMDQSVLQFRSLDGSFSHTQIQGDGRVRVALRGQFQGDNITATNIYLDGSDSNPDASIPFEEWFHFAVTYDMGADNHTIYIDGTPIFSGQANGNAGAIELGDWGQGAWLGLVPDFNRQLVGYMDEFYLFNRALSSEEITALVELQGGGTPGDFNGDGLLDAADIDALTGEVLAGTNGSSFDLNGDNLVNGLDRDVWVNDLRGTYYGDSNLDGEFNSGDFVFVFTNGEYEDAIPGNSTWGDGDWNGDGDFSSGDFVIAFQSGGFEQGPRAAVAAVPEPSSFVLLMLGVLPFCRRRR